MKKEKEKKLREIMGNYKFQVATAVAALGEAIAAALDRQDTGTLTEMKEATDEMFASAFAILKDRKEKVQ